MSVFKNLLKREELLSRAYDIDEDLYEKLMYLSKNVYFASATRILIEAIGDLIETEDVNLYVKNKNIRSIHRSFLIPISYYNALNVLKEKYNNIAIYKLINIALRNAFIKEGIIDNK